MLYGHKDKIDIFKRLIKEDKLSHAYLFFGESYIGKALFAEALFNFLENGDFEKPTRPLTESMIVRPLEGSIKIDAIREARHFMARKPINSQKRGLIIDQAETMTHQAQDALLKLTEEPPEKSLIFLITSGFEAIPSTIRSRLQRVYFPRFRTSQVSTLLQKEHNLQKSRADDLAKRCYGKPGLAIKMLKDEVFKEGIMLSDKLIKNRSGRKEILKTIVEDGPLTEAFITGLIIKLSEDPIKNRIALSRIIDRQMKISSGVTNKRLQLEAATWTL